MQKDKILNICENLTTLFFYLLAAGITFSIALTEIAAFSIIGLWILKKALKQDCKIPGAWPGLLLVIFVAWNLASFINTAYLNESVRGFFKVFKYALLFMAAIDYFNSRQKIRRFLIFSVGVAFFICLNGIVQYQLGRDLLRGHTIDVLDGLHRVSSSFCHPNDFGAYLVVISTIIASLFLSRSRSFKERVLIFIAALPVIWCLISTDSRGAWLSFALSMIILAIIKSKKLLIVVIIFVVASPFIMPKIRERFSDFATISQSAGTVWERAKLWEGTARMIKEHPFLGFGVNTYSRNFPEFKPSDYPDLKYTHNSYLHMASEIGIIGALIFLAFIISIFIFCATGIKYFKKGLDRDLYLGLFAGIIGFLAHCAVDTHLYSVILAVLLYLYLGAAYSYRKVAYTENS